MRPKKTKKQKKEDITYNPIICIGNYYMDKKIKELMKVCTPIELKAPTDNEMKIMERICRHILRGAGLEWAAIGEVLAGEEGTRKEKRETNKQGKRKDPTQIGTQTRPNHKHSKCRGKI